MILVIGLHDPALLASTLLERVADCDLLVGGARHLAAFPEAGHERITIAADIEHVLERVRRAHEAGSRVVVLASGDPLWYGFGATLHRAFPPDALEIIPAPTAAQLAFAALGEPWHDALLLSAHGRPLDYPVERVLEEGRSAAILTDTRNTPGVIAARLLAAGFPDWPAAVCERLTSPAQRVVRLPLSAIVGQTYDPLNVLVILKPVEDPAPAAESAAEKMIGIGGDHPFGLLDEELEHDGLVTHTEVRAVSLAALRLYPSDLIWDIGAGSGSVALEAARITWRGRVYAVERSLERFEHMRRNFERWGAGRVVPYHGVAPEACVGWPSPNAIFIGGSGGRMPDLITFCSSRLRPNGRLVINLVTLESLAGTLELLHAAGLQPTVRQIAVSRSRPLLGQTYLAALNPVYIVSATRAPDGEGRERSV